MFARVCVISFKHPKQLMWHFPLRVHRVVDIHQKKRGKLHDLNQSVAGTLGVHARVSSCTNRAISDASTVSSQVGFSRTIQP